MNCSSLQGQQCLGRAFGLEIGNNGREVSVAGRRRTQPQQPHSHLEKVPAKQEREPTPVETASEQSERGTQMEIEVAAQPTEPTDIYEQEIAEFLVKLEQSRPALSNYFQVQTDISAHMRGILLNWLVEVHLKYKLLPQTLFMAVGLIDRYLERRTIQRGRLQLLGITSLWIAAKFEEIYQVPKVSNLIFICDSTYTRADILEMQGNILLALDFELLQTHSLAYLQVFTRKASLDEKDYFLARYLVEMCLLDFRMAKYSSRHIAAASIFFIKKIRRKTPCWEADLQQTTHLNENDIRQCARDICSLLQNVDENDQMDALKKKFSTPQFKEVGKIKIGQKPRQ